MNYKYVKKYSFIGIGVLVLVAIVHCKDPFVESDYFTPKTLATHSNGERFVGSSTCIECHEDIYNSHSQTAHHKTSAVASEENIKGSFQNGQNTVELLDAKITMIKGTQFFYEKKDYKYGEQNETVSKIDIVIGSGVKGQSYLSWVNNELYQLQASYYTPTNNWINSPNFSNRSTTRAISDACLKCHVTFAKNQDPMGNGNHYENKNIIYGIDCERCHRPAFKHVVYHRKNPDVKEPKFMLLIDTLSRKQRLDICAQCHSGLRSQQKKGNPFSFVPGENLEEYAKNYYSNRPSAELDVHGNQLGLLKSSKCFKESDNLNCSTCHDPHRNQRGNLAYFNEKCISCHSSMTSECNAPLSKTQLMGNNCVTCHMPMSPSKVMKVKLSENEEEAPVYIRSHLIKAYSLDAIEK